MKWAAFILIFCVGVLIGLGMVMLYSASMNMEMNKSTVGAQLLVTQFHWFLCGLFGCIAAAVMDYRRLKGLSPWLLGFSALTLLLVFAPVIGHSSHGAHRWIHFPGVPNVQPSELAKLALILFLAAYGDRYQRQMTGFKKGLVIPGAVTALVLGLI